LWLLFTGFLVFGFYTQRKRKLKAQNDLIQKQAEKLAILDNAKSRFFVNVSHELRTPLSLLLGPINSVLKSGTLDSRNANYLQMAQRSGKDLLKLVGSILDLSKLESGKLKLEEQPEMFFPLIRRIASTFESYAQMSGIEFTFLFRGEEDLNLKIDRKKIETIVNNLLSNAIKFTPAGGEIALIVEDQVSKIRLTIKDTGRGIHPNDLPHVFNRFYQSEEVDAPTEGGTGIGLSLCQSLIKLMEGEIGVISKLNEGSTFYIEFPRKEVLGTRDTISEEEKVAQEKIINLIAATNNSNSRLSTIMIVEDNRSLQEYLRALLSPFYKVITAENGQKALEKLGDVTQQPSLILSDVMMPVMDGFQLLKELKSKDNLRHLPVIMLTARADIQDKLMALRIGVDDYLLKPFEEEELLVRIENLLDNQVARQEVIVKEKPQKATFTITAKDRIWLEKFETYVKDNLTSHLLTVPNLAKNFAMSESSLLRQLKSLTGLSPVKYLQEVRLAKARIFLESGTHESVSKVANEVGYSDARTFSRSYKKRFGKLPSEALQEQ
jgi:DNA-binding response OmpR family regulator/nitrogen-specific signal transduction histidine kinase